MVGGQWEGEPEALQCHLQGQTCPPPCSKLCHPQPKAPPWQRLNVLVQMQTGI